MFYYKSKFGKFYLLAVSAEDFAKWLQISNDDFKSLYIRSFNAAKRGGNYLFYKKNVRGTEEEAKEFSTVGAYLFVTLAVELKKYHFLESKLRFLKEKAFNDLLDIYKEASKTPRKAPNPDSTIEFEDLMHFQIKKIDTSKSWVDHNLVEDKTHKLYDKNVVLTGDFEKFSIRDNFIPHLNKIGCIVRSSVTGKTNYLICGNAPGPSKVKKATELNIPIILEEEFYQLLNL